MFITKVVKFFSVPEMIHITYQEVKAEIPDINRLTSAVKIVFIKDPACF